MGRVEDGLHHPLILGAAELVNHQGQDDGHRKAPKQAVQADEHGVPNHPGEGGGR